MFSKYIEIINSLIACFDDEICLCFQPSCYYSCQFGFDTCPYVVAIKSLKLASQALLDLETGGIYK